MRLHVAAHPRRARLPRVAVTAASLVLLLVALAACFGGSIASSPCPACTTNEPSLVQHPRPGPQEHHHNLSDIKSLLSERSDRLSQSRPRHTPPLSPKLQQNVLSTFSTVSLPAIEPNTQEQSAFVHGYKQLKPMLSATSYLPVTHNPTQGIILPAGKALRLGSAYVTLQLLRESLNCSLPVEIWHVAGEIDEHTKSVFETTFTNVVCRDATRVPHPSHHKSADIQGYALKAFALYATSFTEVILLDADNLPVLNPALLFESPEYKLYGSMFWPDLFALPLSRVSGIQAAAYNLLGLREPWAATAVGNSSFMFAESGQFVLDRKRHADVVEWAWFINSYGDNGVYSQLMNGDKDSFLLAFALANKSSEYYQVPEYVRLCLHDAEGEKFEHVGILHHNPSGQVVFFHRTSGGKVNPMAAPGNMFTTDYTTVPLTAKAAWDMFEGAAESGNYRYPKNRIRTGTLSSCTLLDSDQLLYRPSCKAGLLQEEDDLPVSALTNFDLQGTQLMSVYNLSNTKFHDVQEMMQKSDQQFLKQLPWYR